MFDSLPYRNDAAIVFRRLIRSLPTRRAVIGVATCDKGLPATMIALASMHDLPTILVPGGATLPPTVGKMPEKCRPLVRVSLTMSCRCRRLPSWGAAPAHHPAAAVSFGTAGTSQVVAEALGLALPHSALAPSGQAVWLEIARQSARAVSELDNRGSRPAIS